MRRSDRMGQGSADRLGNRDRHRNRRTGHVQHFGNLSLRTKAVVEQFLRKEGAFDIAEVAPAGVFGNLGAQCGRIVKVRDERSNLLDLVGGTNGLKTSASIDEEIAIGLGRVAPYEDGDGLAVLLYRCAKVMHILGVEAIRVPFVLDLNRIEFPDMVSIHGITRRAERPIT